MSHEISGQNEVPRLKGVDASPKRRTPPRRKATEDVAGEARTSPLRRSRSLRSRQETTVISRKAVRIKSRETIATETTAAAAIKLDDFGRHSAPAWVLARQSARDPWRALQLPLTVGHHPTNDIFVNAPTMRHISRVIVAMNGRLGSFDLQKTVVHPSSDVIRFGIELLGPFAQDPTNLGLVGRGLSRLAMKESEWYEEKIPRVIANALPKTQRPRTIAYAVAAIALMIGVALIPHESVQVIDQSEIPIALNVGNITKLNVGATTSAPSAYSRGATLAFQVSELERERPLVLTLGVSGVDVAEEFSLTINHRPLGTISANLACAEQTCLRDFAIPADALVYGQSNLIKIQHNDPQSSYVLSTAYIRAIEAASREDQEAAEQYLTSAQRYYDERQILIDNVRASRESLDSFKNLRATRSGLESFDARFDLLRRKVDQAFAATVADLEFKMKKEIQLSRPKIALEHLEGLLKLFPEPSSKQNQLLVNLRTSLKKQETGEKR